MKELVSDIFTFFYFCVCTEQNHTFKALVVANMIDHGTVMQYIQVISKNECKSFANKCCSSYLKSSTKSSTNFFLLCLAHSYRLMFNK